MAAGMAMLLCMHILLNRSTYFLTKRYSDEAQIRSLKNAVLNQPALLKGKCELLNEDVLEPCQESPTLQISAQRDLRGKLLGLSSALDFAGD